MDAVGSLFLEYSNPEGLHICIHTTLQSSTPAGSHFTASTKVKSKGTSQLDSAEEEFNTLLKKFEIDFKAEYLFNQIAN
jgi:hypothetical protein